MLFFSAFLIDSLAFILLLSVVVTAHELGHYFMALSNGIKVDEFALGFGREIVGWTSKNGTRWKICILPFGGFCKFFGDEESSSTIVNRDRIKKLSEEERNMCLHSKTPWQRIKVSVAGPMFNYLLAIVCFTLFYNYSGIIRFTNVVGGVIPGSAAEKAGIMAGDVVHRIDGGKIKDFSDLQQRILASSGKPMLMEIVRDDGTISMKITPEIKITKDVFGKSTRIPMIGVESSKIGEPEKVSLFRAFWEALKHVYRISTNSAAAIYQMIVGRQGFGEIIGPIKIAQYSGAVIRKGALGFIYFIALVSSSLGFMNLLPIPMLDGGQVILCLLEILRRKPLSEKFENGIAKIGFFLLISLGIFILIRDLIGVF
ncbi:MAG: M50 family metallopeptidase [Rickettsiales bacterium]|jgi:regulator of sigma E protease|nr:M50 family metallopeptidase [Rickettsiales bacterium]